MQAQMRQMNTTTELLEKELRELKESFDLALIKPFDTEAKTYLKYIAFALDDELFAWPVANLKEIVMNRKIVPIPGTGDNLHGAVNYKNQVLPITNLRYYLGLRLDEPGRANTLMVVKDLAFETAFPVDRLEGILVVDEQCVKPKPVSLDQDIAAMITGEIVHDGRMIALLNPAMI